MPRERERERAEKSSAEAVSVSGYPAKWLVAQVAGTCLPTHSTSLCSVSGFVRLSYDQLMYYTKFGIR